MKRNIWVVGAVLAAMVGFSSCAPTERWVYGNSKNSREDIVKQDRNSNPRNRTYGDDEGGLLDRKSQNEERTGNSYRNNSSYQNPYRESDSQDSRMSYRSTYNNPYRSSDSQDSYRNRYNDDERSDDNQGYSNRYDNNNGRNSYNDRNDNQSNDRRYSYNDRYDNRNMYTDTDRYDDRNLRNGNNNRSDPIIIKTGIRQMVGSTMIGMPAIINPIIGRITTEITIVIGMIIRLLPVRTHITTRVIQIPIMEI